MQPGARPDRFRNRLRRSRFYGIIFSQRQKEGANDGEGTARGHRGDAAGMSAAAQAKRLNKDLDVIAFEKGPHTSYSA